MSGKRTNKSAVSRRLSALVVGSGFFASAIGLWIYKRDYDAQQQTLAAEREARLAALRTEAEAKRIQAERRAGRTKSAERVGQLYREIENLNHLGDKVQMSRERQLRMLETNELQSKVTR